MENETGFWYIVHKTMSPYSPWPYLIISGAGILFALIIGDRKSVREIFGDALKYVFFMAVLWLLVMGLTRFLITH